MKIVIGADHRGFSFKEYIKEHLALKNETIGWLDVGTFNVDHADYPIYAEKLCREILDGNAQYGILLCGTGVGMAIVANRFSKIYAGLVWNAEVARLSKEDDNINVLVLPSDFVSQDQVLPIIDAWLSAKFNGGHYQARIDMIDQLKTD